MRPEIDLPAVVDSLSVHGEEPCVPQSVMHDPPEPARTLMAAMLRSALAQAEPPAWLLNHPLQLASPTARQVLWALGRRLTRNPDIGFVVAESVREDAVGSLWPLHEAAPSLRALALHYDAWSALLLDFASYRPHDERDITWFRTCGPRGLALDRAEQDCRTSMQLKCWRRLSRSPQLTPVAAHFTYPRPTHLGWHTRLLGGATLRFSQPYFQLGLARASADAPLPGADVQAYDRLLARACSAARAVRGGTLPERVEALIAERLAAAPQEQEVAASLGLSERSLRRKLADRGTTFRALVARVRQREYELYIQASLSKLETARFLGFANRGALRNALRRL